MKDDEKPFPHEDSFRSIERGGHGITLISPSEEIL